MPRVVPSHVVDLIDQLFPLAKREQGDWEQERGVNSYRLDWGQYGFFVTALLDLLEQVPKELLLLPPDEYAHYVVGLAAIRDTVDFWKADRAARQTSPLNPLPNYRIQVNPVTLVRHALSRCPDAIAAAAAPTLAFVDDELLRKGLQLDLGSAHNAYVAGEWKAATVLGGSVVEALLLWRLKKFGEADLRRVVDALKEEAGFRRPPSLEPVDWNLHQYIAVAERLEVIGHDVAAEARMAKDYRNLIHAGVEVREGTGCDRHTALQALTAVYGVEKELRRAGEAH